MRKVHYQEDHEELFKLCGGQMCQLFEDRFIKSAASDTFSRDELRKHAPDKDHFMLHLVAMGDQETYGFNKNGDSFPKDSLIKYSNTFVTHGHFFREHRNRDAKTQGIGIVKAAAYNPQMHRTEIVVWGDREKAAAEYEKAKSGKPLSFSMSCRIKEDECSCCHKKASTPSNYCEHLRPGAILRYQPEFKKYAFAINEKPCFFDISAVKNPADRIAHYLQYAFPDEEDRQKAASQYDTITGSQWAEYEGVTIPDYPAEWSTAKWDVLTKLAAAAKVKATKEAGTSPRNEFIKNVVPMAYSEDLNDEEIATMRQLQPATLFGELAKRASVLPFRTFTAFVNNRPIEEVSNDPIVKQALTIHLPGIFDSLMGSPMPDIGNIFHGASPGFCCNDSENDDVVQDFMDQVSAKFSCKTEPVKRRVIRIISVKSASAPDVETSNQKISKEDDCKSRTLAETYAMYKLAALQDIISIHGNDIDEPQYLLLA